MTNEDMLKAALFDYPEYIPVNVSFLPATWMKYRLELDDLIARHPVIFGSDQRGPYLRRRDAVLRWVHQQRGLCQQRC